jgi:hypothetical protein
VNLTSPAKRILIAVGAAVLGIVMLFLVMSFLGIPSGVRPQVYWQLSSREYKHAVLSSAKTSDELAHVEWDGDGWGGTPGGDWTAYVVYDPTDSLPLMRSTEPARKIKGVRCDVVAVRRLERGWYTVVTDMNQFWDARHPTC